MHRYQQLTLSDLHVGEGPVYADGWPNPLEEFHRDQEFVLFLNIIHVKYGVEIICLNLLGDTLDPRQVRFRGKLIDPPFQAVALYKVRAIIRGHPIFFDALKKWVERGHRIDFFFGNHDAILRWPKVQTFIRARIACANPNAVRFLLEKTEDGTYLAHGNRDPISRLDAKNPFSHRGRIINLPDDSIFHVGVVNALKQFDPRVGRMEGDRNAPLYREAICRDWRLLYLAVYLWIATLFWSLYNLLRDPHISLPRRFGKTLRLIWKIFFHTFGNVIFGIKLGKEAEKILKEDGVQAVIFGHTHEALLVSHEDGRRKQWCGNTGTWTARYVRRPRTAWQKLCFWRKDVIVREDKLTYILTTHEDGHTTNVELREFVSPLSRPGI